MFHGKATSPLFLDFLLCLRATFCHSSTSKKSLRMFNLLNLPQKRKIVTYNQALFSKKLRPMRHKSYYIGFPHRLQLADSRWPSCCSQLSWNENENNIFHHDFYDQIFHTFPKLLYQISTKMGYPQNPPAVFRQQYILQRGDTLYLALSSLILALFGSFLSLFYANRTFLSKIEEKRPMGHPPPLGKNP